MKIKGILAESGLTNFLRQSNRMMVAYLLGEILPSSPQAAYASVVASLLAGVMTKTVGFQAIFGAAWSSIEM
jgi:hypothetical protein